MNSFLHLHTVHGILSIKWNRFENSRNQISKLVCKLLSHFRFFFFFFWFFFPLQHWLSSLPVDFLLLQPKTNLFIVRFICKCCTTLIFVPHTRRHFSRPFLTFFFSFLSSHPARTIDTDLSNWFAFVFIELFPFFGFNLDIISFEYLRFLFGFRSIEQYLLNFHLKMSLN